MADNTNTEFNLTYAYPASEKIYLSGSRDDMRVGMRQINLSDTTQADGSKTPNAPLRVYDTSGPYTDPAITVDVTKGLAPVREQWIEDRGDTEFSAITSRESNRIAIK